ncbi:AAEL007232-PA [Aedes aegypti]|uniref:AAEL007232-PA n=1 Tax=Aedes aegypti TaxID=7159 RepID=Q172Y2_AEDAE|nr:AAEL007232-PA [Aedes aegypti]
MFIPHFQKKQFPLSSNPAGKSWLEVWSKETRKKQQFNKDKHRDAVGAASTNSMPLSPTISESAYNQLQQLYGMNRPNKEEAIGTIPAAELDARLKQLETLRAEVNPFKPMPAETADSEANEVDARKPLADVPFKPMPVATAGGTKKPLESGPEPRKNLRRRKNPSGNGPRVKDKISADLADVSLD